jgi:hypothetical protein
MREELAERLLMQVLDWTPAEFAQERPTLQAMAEVKYDDYQQYSPGMRFVGSLAIWLSQFADVDERRTAYEFIKNDLVFISFREMQHLVSIAFQDYIKPILLRRAAEIEGANLWNGPMLSASTAYHRLRRRSLFLGLSDGARVDTFRRANPELEHEQIWQAYDLSKEKVDDMHDETRKWLEIQSEEAVCGSDATFRYLFLLDDFAGSGRTYLRTAGEVSQGKLLKIQRTLEEDDIKSTFSSDLRVVVVLYVCTEQALAHLTQGIQEHVGTNWQVCPIQLISDELAESVCNDAAMMSIAEAYHDPLLAVDPHMLQGRCQRPWLGFDECASPVVLYHNAPNNALSLLWYQKGMYRALFPRVSRHKGELGQQ